jgi:hypothetical protein
LYGIPIPHGYSFPIHSAILSGSRPVGGCSRRAATRSAIGDVDQSRCIKTLAILRAARQNRQAPSGGGRAQALMLPLKGKTPLTTAHKQGTERLALPAKPALLPVPSPHAVHPSPCPAVLPGVAVMPALQARPAMLYSSHVEHRRSRSSTQTRGTHGGKSRNHGLS